MRAGHENISKKPRHMQAPGQPDLCVGHVISVIGSSSLAEAFSGNSGAGSRWIMITRVATSSVNSMGFFIAAVVDFSDLVLFCRLFPVLACFGTLPEFMKTCWVLPCPQVNHPRTQTLACNVLQCSSFPNYHKMQSNSIPQGTLQRTRECYLLQQIVIPCAT